MKIWSVAAVLLWGMMDASSAAQGVKRIRRFTIEVNDGEHPQSEQQQQFVELQEGFYKYEHGGRDKKKKENKVTDIPFFDMDDIMRYLRVDSFSLSLPYGRPSAPSQPSPPSAPSPPRNPTDPSGVPTAPSTPTTPSPPSSPTTPSPPSSPTSPSTPTTPTSPSTPAPFASPSGGSGTEPTPSPVDGDLDPLSTETPAASPVDDPTTGGGVPTTQPSSSPTGQPQPGVTPAGDCNVTDRSGALFNLTTTISDEFSLGVMGTPPFLARLWMDQQDNYQACPDEENREATLQRYALAVLYFSLGGSGWNKCVASKDDCVGAARWLDPVSECEWFGVTCDENGVVVKIVLKENGLKGQLPGELFSLLDLKQLSLDHNEISGDIPGDFIVLQQLEILELDANQLSGSIPIQLYQMPSLQALDLNNNTLTGGLSSQASNWANLMVLQLENNQLQGPVPTASFLQLPNLILFSINGNDLTGTLEPICNVLDERRAINATYLQFFSADCQEVTCPCCSECF